MNLKIDNRMVLGVVAIVCFLASAVLPLATATSNCPASGVPITSSLTLNSDCTYTSQNGIELGANSITLNCANHNIIFSGAGNYKGIYNEKGAAVTGDTVENCKVNGGWQWGMYFEFMSGLTLRGNNIAGSVTGSGYGIYMEYVGPATISGNTIKAYEDGVYCDEYCSSLTVSGNTATGTSSDDYGFYLDDSCNLLLSGNTATSNSYAGFYMDDAAGFTLRANTANSNGYAGFYDDSYGSGPFGIGNIYSGNTCKLNGSYGSYDGEANEGPAYLCTPQG